MKRKTLFQNPGKGNQIVLFPFPEVAPNGGECQFGCPGRHALHRRKTVLAEHRREGPGNCLASVGYKIDGGDIVPVYGELKSGADVVKIQETAL